MNIFEAIKKAFGEEGKKEQEKILKYRNINHGDLKSTFVRFTKRQTIIDVFESLEIYEIDFKEIIQTREIEMYDSFSVSNSAFIGRVEHSDITNGCTCIEEAASLVFSLIKGSDYLYEVGEYGKELPKVKSIEKMIERFFDLLCNMTISMNISNSVIVISEDNSIEGIIRMAESWQEKLASFKSDDNSQVAAVNQLRQDLASFIKNSKIDFEAKNLNFKRTIDTMKEFGNKVVEKVPEIAGQILIGLVATEIAGYIGFY